MSLIVKEFGGFVLKYVGDAVLAFFVVSSHQSQAKAACTHAINCAKCMLQVADNGINPILNQYNCPAMNMRIGIDIGENAIIQSGWDIHPKMIDMKNDSDNNITKKELFSLKKPVYDILGYSISIAVKMTTLANPNHMAIGQLVYDALDDSQKSLFQQLDFSPSIWSYTSNNTGENIYNVYTNK
jgi:adenylate cyclase